MCLSDKLNIDMDLELTIGHNKVIMAKMWLSDTTMYITTHKEISDTKTEVETKMLISYTSKFVTTQVLTIWQDKVVTAQDVCNRF